MEAVSLSHSVEANRLKALLQRIRAASEGVGNSPAMATICEFITFLQERYGKRTAVDVSDAWSEEDLHDLIRASLAHAERTIWAGEEEYG